MGGSPPKPVTAPPVPPPEAIPDITEETGDIAKKKVYRGGRAKTFLTGALEPETLGKKKLLG